MKLKYTLPILGFATISASLIIIGKKLSTLSPSFFLLLSVCTAVLAYIPYISLREYKKVSIKTGALLVLSGFFGPFLANYVYYEGMTYSNALKVSLINALNPTVTCLFAFLFLRRTPHIAQIIALILSLIGMVFVITQGVFSNIVAHFGPAELFLFTSVIGFSFYSVLIATLSKHFSAKFIAFNTMLLSIPFYAVLFFVNQNNTSVWHITPYQWFSILYIGIIGMLLNYSLYSTSIRYIGPAKTSFYVRSISPMFAAIFSFIIFGDIISRWDILGFVLIINALYLNNKYA